MEKLDLKEDCTATLLCYLELKGWLEITNAVCDICTIKWSGGPGSEQLKALENKGFPVVAAAAAKLREEGTLIFKFISVLQCVFAELKFLLGYHGLEEIGQSSHSLGKY